ncbi:MAG: TetR/AcrR family transcriptional regulator [Oliverpabstia sp.]|nr:TetR/AcrR family transcriptional regulator [Lachnospiraceae bacterium]MDY5027126.1 TetR/AcrR family transcriptional regulator [Oliverpabstia sp.]
MRQEEKTELTKAKILGAAMEEFGINGYANGSINNICKKGINKGLIYHNYKDKDELYMICVKKSCERMIDFMDQENAESSMDQYMNARMRFFKENTSEAHIFFEALLDPPQHLKVQIREAMKDFEALNVRMYEKTISGLTLRENVSKEDALRYFSLFQEMFNVYFCSSAFQTMDFEEKIQIHESTIPRILNFMLYGIAERRDTNS